MSGPLEIIAEIKERLEGLPPAIEQQIQQLLQSQENAPLPASPSPPLSTLPSDIVEASLFESHNNVRRASRVEPLVFNELLAAAARGHADDLARNATLYVNGGRKLMSFHQGSDGSTMTDRIHMLGYEYRLCGENVAYSAQDPMSLWLSSTTHKGNILNTSYLELGVGRSGNFWVAVFGTPA